MTTTAAVSSLSCTTSPEPRSSTPSPLPRRRSGDHQCRKAQMLDIVVSGGLAVLPSGPEPADVAVVGEHIVAIGAPGSLAAIGAGRTIDAAGQIVTPAASTRMSIATGRCRCPGAPTIS